MASSMTTGLSYWPVSFEIPCPALEPHRCDDAVPGRVRRAIVALLVSGFLIAGLVGLLAESGSAFRGDELTFQERASVSTASDVSNVMFASGDERFLEAFIAPDAEIHYPGGTAAGPEGGELLAQLIGDRASSMLFDRVEGETVIMDWRLAGPIPPGWLVWHLVPAGSAVSGELEMVVRDGVVLDIAMYVTS